MRFGSGSRAASAVPDETYATPATRQVRDDGNPVRDLFERLGRFAFNALPPLAVLVSLFAAWEIYVAASGISRVTLPPPSHILEASWRNRDLLWGHSLVTLKETVLGLGLSIVVAIGLALLIDAFAPVRRALYPLLVGSQTLPVVVIAPLIIFWFGFDLTPKILVVTLYTFFPITVAFASGLAATSEEALVLMRTLGAGRLKTLALLKVPQATPYLFTGLRISVTYAMIGAVFAEWSGAREGLGIYILQMKNSFRTDMVLAAV
ncbi:MAG TPA: ABC transporter permease, partial [Dehalococcoidia bacterium]|nr:ABC transporter permease [Dehalococcoidia bacterium]